DGSARTVDVVSRVTDKPVTEVGDLIAEIEDTLARARDVGAAIGADIFVWKMAVFGNPDRVDEMIGKARGCKTLILDLRGNGGGAVDAPRELVSRSVDREVFVALEKQRGRGGKEIARRARDAFTCRRSGV